MINDTNKSKETMKEIENVLEKLNEKVSNIREKLIELEFVKNPYTNKKLYGVFSSLNEGEEDLFYQFCEEENTFLQDIENEKNVEEDYIGRTSTFRFAEESYGESLHGLFNILCEYNKEIFTNKDNWVLIDALLYECSECLSAYEWVVYEDKCESNIEKFYNDYKNNDKIFYESYKEEGDDFDAFEVREEAFIDILKTLNAILESIDLEKALDALNDVKECYDYLDNFQKHQLEYWEEWKKDLDDNE